mmetsp:Transcript_20979/g.59500  ORF Transcript_20979/g.59500 Transcript_20979/m.59500 type:complete len:305 (-) Transcript_20979:481-1395(-)
MLPGKPPSNWRRRGGANSIASSLVLQAQLHNAVCHLLHRRVVEHQRRRQLDAQVLLQAVSERHRRQAIHAAVHQRAVQVQRLVQADGSLGHLLHGSHDVLGVEALRVQRHLRGRGWRGRHFARCRRGREGCEAAAACNAERDAQLLEDLERAILARLVLQSLEDLQGIVRVAGDPLRLRVDLVVRLGENEQGLGLQGLVLHLLGQVSGLAGRLEAVLLHAREDEERPGDPMEGLSPQAHVVDNVDEFRCLRTRSERLRRQVVNLVLKSCVHNGGSRVHTEELQGPLDQGQEGHQLRLSVDALRG